MYWVGRYISLVKMRLSVAKCNMFEGQLHGSSNYLIHFNQNMSYIGKITIYIRPMKTTLMSDKVKIYLFYVFNSI